MKTFKLLDYTAQVFYNKEQHYPFCLHLYDDCTNKQLHVGYYVTIEQIGYMTHLDMLDHQYHALNPVQTLLAIEEMKESLYLWMEVMGED
jgi:hypothetical protein